MIRMKGMNDVCSCYFDCIDEKKKEDQFRKPVNRKTDLSCRLSYCFCNTVPQSGTALKIQTYTEGRRYLHKHNEKSLLNLLREELRWQSN